MRSKPVEVRLDPEDNQRLARLCGSLDENLRQIESALDVTIARRGAKFTVRGEQAQRAAQAIEHFYDRASSELTLDDVQLALTEVLQGNRPPPDEGPQLLTRRQDLHGRTPHQIWCAPRSRPASVSVSFPATWRRKWIRTCGRFTTRCTT